MTIDFAREGFRAAPTEEERVFEAARLFGQGRTGANPEAQYRLLEAFSTSDFTDLLAKAFATQAVQAQKDAVDEFSPILFETVVDDFKKHRLIDLWENNEFELVREGEEYKSGSMDWTELYHSTAKHGKQFGLTYEMRRNRDFGALANFPRMLGNGSIRGQNTAVINTLLKKDGTWAITSDVKTEALTPDTLDAALKTFATRKDHRGDLVDTSDLVLLHGPALTTDVYRLMNAAELEFKITSGAKVTTTRTPNPFRGRFTSLESRTLGKHLKSPTAWAIVQGKNTTLPSLIRTKLSGEETVDIRVKRDQGASVGGGDLSIEAGSFKDDTIWFRGRDFYGIDRGFDTGVYASSGEAAA